MVESVTGRNERDHVKEREEEKMKYVSLEIDHVENKREKEITCFLI